MEPLASTVYPNYDGVGRAIIEWFPLIDFLPVWMVALVIMVLSLAALAYAGLPLSL